ncbi:DUF6631 family protein [Ralstonia mannitolilytica]|uniref:Uncharacterized protein n=1 Tax=Ralstonia mannitolilytica TaxID=105219 RepID=A0AAJ4ZHX5_9RALS|nr:DUF6631 family protein [Ralstonia mannitolilytica]CAG2153221.1 hypothetical protein LMG6866_04400 [Ralstonia mannitolilytica]SUD89581.1 Uncharacterised protein [Ralstonia mannitolilytica]SUD95961.1 Uncharacterised protein [Ralstonia mannitolilytica]
MPDFETFPPVPKVVTVAGTAVELTPIRLGELPRLLAAVRPIAADLSADLSAEPDWLDLLARHGEEVLELLTLATRRERAWIEGLALDEAVTLACAVFEVNADFFVRRVAPSIARSGERLAPILSAGTTPSPGSSPPATATPR